MKKNIRSNISTLTNDLVDIMEEAMDLAKDSSRKSKIKLDNSIVTEGDIKVDDFIYKNLKKLKFDFPIISEERNFNKKDFFAPYYWIIDPIDGSFNFSKGQDEYTVNICLIERGYPIFGIIGHPPSKRYWYGFKGSKYNNLKEITKHSTFVEKPKYIISKSLDVSTKKFISLIDSPSLVHCSSSLKFCKVADLEANIYPRLQSIKKWDIAAGHAILKSIGGSVIDITGKEFNYASLTEYTESFFAISNIKYWDHNIKKTLKKLDDYLQPD